MTNQSSAELANFEDEDLTDPRNIHHFCNVIVRYHFFFFSQDSGSIETDSHFLNVKLCHQFYMDATERAEIGPDIPYIRGEIISVFRRTKSSNKEK